MHTITKSIATFATATILINAMAPMLAHAAKHLQGAEVNTTTLVRDAYIAVTYYDGNNRERTAKGWIDAIGETSFTIRSGGLKGKTTIAYAKVLSIIMSEASTVPAKQMNEVNRFMKNEQMKAVNVTVMAREEIAPGKITKGWYANVVYSSEGVKGTTTGWITAKDSEYIVIENREGFKKWKIAYSDIDTLATAKYQRAIKEWQNSRQAIQRFKTHNAKVRIKTPSISKRRIIGEVVKMNRDTLLIRKGRTFFQVPMSLISNFEVSLGQRRNTDKGFKIGLGLGLAVFAPVAFLDLTAEEDAYLRGIPTIITAVYISLPIVVLSTLIGAGIKSDKWVEVSPQRLNLSIAPTPEKGLRAALTVNF